MTTDSIKSRLNCIFLLFFREEKLNKKLQALNVKRTEIQRLKSAQGELEAKLTKANKKIKIKDEELNQAKEEKNKDLEQIKLVSR